MDRTRAAVYIALLAAAATFFLAWPIWRAQFLIELWPTESWNAYWQDAAAAGLPIYPTPDSLVGNNYPPLSFYAVGLLGRMFHADNLFVGRCLSLIGLFIVSAETFFAVRLLTGEKLGSAVAALWYLAIMARNSTAYIGVNDPQIAGLAIMGAGLLWFLHLYDKKVSPVPALMIMVIAGFWKHNNVAIPLTSLTWLYVSRSHFAHRGLIASFAAVSTALIACVSLFGPNFISDLLATRQYAWSNVLINVGHLQWSALALLIWGAWAIFNRRTQAAKFTSIHIGSAAATCILQWLGHGVGGNAEFDLIFALAIGVGVTFNRMEASWLALRIGPTRCRDAMIAALLLRLFLADRQETALLMLSPEFRSSVYKSESNVLAEAKIVAAVPGKVACVVKLVCRKAGKPFTVDEFKTDELVATGRATPADIEAMLREQQIKLMHRTLPTGAEAETSIIRWWRGSRPCIYKPGGVM